MDGWIDLFICIIISYDQKLLKIDCYTGMCYGNIGYWKFVILAESVISPFFHAMALVNLNSGHLLISLKGDATLKGKN